ncbi:DUF4209 domain-containing protein [Xanthomonas campestris]|uniref:DUF4209 domain-containing protein n=1 Tax=Xanthomonas campestris TaxID=339 RepID=UPI000E328DA7|nr:DUF4209 domain-containing protein [Xanthomonas campestris]MEA9490701.1 DUF4209 domain-containing protein [Xanthomonas campestris]MEA9509995.1 DUF4209 domain-containing protein [Xanthomonas campestris]MEA9575547.1 DUF4209 domain-containing protein [Xanthomonas campestris]MEB2110391.1 DUF4209 domain-containing protein [Xanthomonas campestris pv. campestris]RFF71691.1 DUF4209 domain-containing protein [Xanthomonas campestris pv. campestris]
MDSETPSNTETVEVPSMPPGIIDQTVSLEILDHFDWESHLKEHDWTHHRWDATQLTDRRSEKLVEEGLEQEALVLKLLSAVISMHFRGNLPEPFGPMWQDGNRCSPAPQHLGQLDVQFLQAMAKSAKNAWLKARLADVACVAGPSVGLKGWEMGSVAAQAYLDHAKKYLTGNEPIKAMDVVECLQRAMHLGWKYRRKDDAFREDVWMTATNAIDHAINKKQLGIISPLTEEIIQRQHSLAQATAEKLEKAIDSWSGDDHEAVVDNIPSFYKKAARLWHVAKDSARSETCYHKTADALILKARGNRQAMVRADWIAEGIALLRRHRGDRTKIKELQSELAEIRRTISDEMHSVSHEIDTRDLIAFIEQKVTSTDLPTALFQIAFAFSTFTSVEQIKAEVIETSKKYVFQHLFARVVYNDEGVPVERGDAFDANEPANLEQHMIENICRFHHPLLANVAVMHATSLVRNRCEPTLNDLLALTHASPVVPEGHEWSMARGLLAGLEHDWEEAAIFLIPQAEPFVRAAFKRRNLNTLAIKEGIEQEKSLSELLGHEDIAQVFHEDIVMDLKAILTHRSGHNLRNLFGHGLIKDEHLASTATIVLWWALLRLIMWPYRQQLIEKI